MKRSPSRSKFASLFKQRSARQRSANRTAVAAETCESRALLSAVNGAAADATSPEQLAQNEIDTYDKDGDKALSVAELTEEFKPFTDTAENAAASAKFFVDTFDTNNDQKLDLDELTKTWGGYGDDSPDSIPDGGTIGAPEELAKSELADYDTDKDGALSVVELTAEFKSFGDTDEMATEYASILVDSFDTNNDQKLNLEELTTSWGGGYYDGGTDDGGSTGDGGIDGGSSDSGQGTFEWQTPEQLATSELATYDTNKDGSMSADELKAEFEEMGYSADDSQQYATDLLTAFDEDSDAKLSYAELVKSWGGTGDYSDSFTPEAAQSDVDDFFSMLDGEGLNPLG